LEIYLFFSVSSTKFEFVFSKVSPKNFDIKNKNNNQREPRGKEEERVKDTHRGRDRDRALATNAPRVL
jgi:hypothetical protein